MNALDNQKDFYIKSKLQEDDLISKKADDIFNNFLKGEIKMEEKSNVNEKVVNINDAKDKKFRRKKILSIVATLVVVFLGVNVYAATQGYNNIFFIIKNLVSSETVTDRDEILSDKDITISYQPIEVASNLNIQINKLAVKENKATLTIKLDETNPLEYFPTKYVVYDITGDRKELLGTQANSGDRDEDIIGVSYVEEIKLTGFKNDTSKLQFDMFDQNEEIIASLEIDLENKEIDVLTSKGSSLEKISEIELKEILGLYANLLSYDSFNAADYMSKKEFKETTLVELAMLKLLEKDDYQTRADNEYSIKEVHKAIEELCGTYYEDPIKLEYSIIYFDEEKKCYAWDAGDGLGPALCLDVKDIEFKDGIYKVNFIYCFASDIDYLENSIESLDKYEATLELSINSNYEFFKYRIVNFDDMSGDTYIEEDKTDKEETNNSPVTTVPEHDKTEENHNSNNNNNNNNSNNTITEAPIKDNTVKEENNNKENTKPSNSEEIKNVDNYASSMNWTTLYTPGLKTRVPSDWNVQVIKNVYTGIEDNLKPATIVSGLAQGINRETNEIINSNMKITYYMPDMMDHPITLEEYTKQIANMHGAQYSGTGYSDGTNLQWSEARIINGDAETYYYCHVELSDNGTRSVGFVVGIEVDYIANYKVTNIMNWIFGDIKTTSF